MEGPPLRAVERSRPIVDQQPRICLYFSTGRRLSDLAPDKLIRHVSAPQIPDSSAAMTLKRKKLPSTPLPLPAWEAPLIPEELTSEIPDKQRMDPTTRRMSQLCIKDIAPPNSFTSQEALPSRTPSSVNPTSLLYPPGDRLRRSVARRRG